MNLLQAEILAHQLIRAHAPEGTYFEWSSRTSALGDYSYSRQRVRLSRRYTLTNSEDVVRNVLLHEIAHAVAGRGTGHGPVWQAAAAALGATPRACVDVDSVNVHHPAGGYIAVCPRCKMTHWRARRTVKTYGCGACRQPGEARGVIAPDRRLVWERR